MAVFGVHDDLGQVKGKVSNGNGWNEAFPNHQMRKGIKWLLMVTFNQRYHSHCLQRF